MQVVFIGLAGSGKSTWGRRLASRLNVPFADLDVLVESAMGATIPDIFAAGHHEAFRACEARLLGALLRSPAHGVVATGGGAAMAKGVDWREAHVVWLNPPLSEIERRLREEWRNRPLLAAAGATGWTDVLHSQSTERHDRYAALADDVWRAEDGGDGAHDFERLVERWPVLTGGQDK